MKKSTKAALFSTLLFPGAGLLWLKYYWRAAVFIVPALAAACYIFICMQEVTGILQQRVLNGSLHVDLSNLDHTIAKISEAVRQIIETQQYHFDFAQWIFIASWACSIASSYFVGKTIEQSEQKEQNEQNEQNEQKLKL